MQFHRLIFLILFAFLGIKNNAISQQTNYLIQLKSGGVFKGELLSSPTAPEVEIKLFSGEKITINRTSIASLIKEKKQYFMFDNGSFTATNGPYFNITFSIFPGWEETPWSEQSFLVPGAGLFKFSGGWRLNQLLDVGLGIGFDAYDEAYIPLFAEARLYCSKKQFAPFVGTKVGRSLLLNFGNFNGNNSKGGLMFHPTIGFKIATKRRSEFFMESGIKIQNHNRHFQNGVDKKTYRRYSLGIGWTW